MTTTNTNTTIVETETEETNDTNPRILALAKFLEIDAEEVSESTYDEKQFDAEGGEYLVLTDSEADDRAAKYIKDSLWAFNASFLAGETSIDQDVYDAIIKNDKCESNNDAMLSLISSTCGIEDFVKSAISADGRGHFMSSYDGEENEAEVNGETFYIYRTN